MIPFFAAQVERGSGVIAQEVRPIVPSMFEQKPSPVITGIDGVDSVEVHSSAAVEPPLGNEHRPERARHEHSDSVPQRHSSQSHAHDDIEPSAVRSVIPASRERQTQPPLTHAPLEASHLQSSRASTLAPPEKGFLEHEHVNPEPHAAPRPFEETRTLTPTPPWDAIHSQLDDLSRRLNASGPSPSLSPIVPPSPHVNEPDQQRTPPTPSPAASPPIHEPRTPTGILSQQPIPQIVSVNTPASAPVVTVSIGRIEFRNSARRNDSQPQPASQSPKPESRVLSLEDYLRHRSAGGS